MYYFSNLVENTVLILSNTSHTVALDLKGANFIDFEVISPLEESR